MSNVKPEAIRFSNVLTVKFHYVYNVRYLGNLSTFVIYSNPNQYVFLNLSQ